MKPKILTKLLDYLDIECDYNTEDYDIVSEFTEYIINEFPEITYSDIEDNIYVEMDYEVPASTKMYYYLFRINDELENLFAEKYPEYLI